MIRLFIENKEVELDSNVQFAITKQFEDITNPTTIINDWSKTVEIPFTQSNNTLFGCIFNPDKVIVDGGMTGIYFNPLKKLTFRLEWGDSVIMQGYCKFNEIKQNNGKGTYSITLFGELGKVFSEMKKITFDKSTEDTDYLIDGSKYVDEYINKELVHDSWTSTGQTSPYLEGNFTNYIGFAPNNSFDDGFDYKTWQNEETESTTFEKTLTENNFKEATGVEPSTAIPNGLYPREIGEYRSYLQLPYIYFNKLFKVFQAKAEDITGYKFDLSSNWFSTSNPYWYDLVYMLRGFNFSKGSNYENKYSFSSVTASWRYNVGGFVNSDKTLTTTLESISEGYEIYNNDKFEINNNISVRNSNTFILRLSSAFVNFLPSTSAPALTDDNALIVSYYINGEKTNKLIKICVYSNSTTDTNVLQAAEDADIAIAIDKTGTIESNIRTWEIPITLPTEYFNYFTNGNYYNYSVYAEWLNNNPPFYTVITASDVVIGLKIQNLSVNSSVIYDAFISNSHFTLNNLWNNDYNLFQEILNYCKIYRIGIFVDEFTKTISFKPLTEYFADYKIVDWTDKIDKSKDYIIKPITFENKYIKFNYEDTDTKLTKQYIEKYGVNYGEYRLVSEYNFNEDTENLFDGVELSINNTDNVLSWTNLHGNKVIIYSFPAEIYVYNKNDEGKNVDCFGRYYFFNGLKSFDTTLQLRNVVISDDTAFQQDNDTYFYSQSYNNIGVATYPYLSVIKDNKLCLFAKPMENYTYLTKEYDNSEGIYNQVWQDYINERYNVNNKIVTCYIKLKPSDYMKFQFNQFVRIGNQLYMVNKIYDYDITSSETTKVDLITIQDIKGYTTNNFTLNN